MSDHLFWLSEEQFARLRPLLPDKVGGVPGVDDGCVISGIVHVLKSGCRWVDAPPDYGPRKTLCNSFVRWAEKGVWHDIFIALADAGGPPSQTLIDSSAVRPHVWMAERLPSHRYQLRQEGRCFPLGGMPRRNRKLLALKLPTGI